MYHAFSYSIVNIANNALVWALPRQKTVEKWVHSFKKPSLLYFQNAINSTKQMDVRNQSRFCVGLMYAKPSNFPIGNCSEIRARQNRCTGLGRWWLEELPDPYALHSRPIHVRPWKVHKNWFLDHIYLTSGMFSPAGETSLLNKYEYQGGK